MNRTPRRRHALSVQSPLETYLREINETSLLSADDEHQLAIAIGEGDTQARDRMVRANLRLVVNIARGYTGKGLGLQDLIEEGNLGLSGPWKASTRPSAPASRPMPAIGSSSRSSGRYQHGQDDPHPGLHGRVVVEVAAGQQPAGRRAGPHAHPRGSRPVWACRERNCRSSRRPSASTTSRRKPTRAIRN